jgi:hypothetical protein
MRLASLIGAYFSPKLRECVPRREQKAPTLWLECGALLPDDRPLEGDFYAKLPIAG